MKKGLCVLMAIVLALSVLATVVQAADKDTTISEATKDEADVGMGIGVVKTGISHDIAATGYTLLNEMEFAQKMTELKAKYPAYKTADYTYYENGTALAWTCMGYASKLAYYCFGSSQYTSKGGWSKSTNKSSFNAGDMVRVDNDGHSIFITYVNGTKIKYTEGNYNWPSAGYNSVVRWNVETTLSALQGRFTYKWHLSGNNLTGIGLQPVDLGTKFYANITATANSNMAMAANDSNVYLNTIDYSNYQKWCFERQSDNTYKITNVKTGKCLDLTKNDGTKGTNVEMWIDNGNAAQRWYIVKNDTSYRFVPKSHTDMTLDITGAKLVAGTNIEIWTQNTGNAQRFNITKTVHPVSNLGKKFTANILSSNSNMLVAANDANNVFIDDASGDGYQEWIFEQQADKSYKITNVKLNKCLDVYSGYTANGTNIQVYNSNNGNGQRWYIVQDGINYRFIPKSNVEAALDICGAKFTKGTNIQEYTQNTSDAQKFYLDYLDCEPSVIKEYDGHKYEYYDLNASWYMAYKFCERQGGHLVTISSAEENDLVYSMIDQRIWIGNCDIGRAKDWYTVNSETSDYTNWREGQPDSADGLEHFASMYYTGYPKQWNDLPEVSLSCFVCEYDDIIAADHYTPILTQSIDGKKYEIYEDSVDWQTAKNICEKKGGNLIVIGNAEENNLILDVISQSDIDDFWIGISDNHREGIWNDVLGKELRYTNWSIGEPNNSSRIEDYAYLQKSDGKWNDYKSFGYAYHHLGFICEYDVEQIPTEVSTVSPTEEMTEDITEPPVIPYPTEYITPSYLGDADGDGGITSIDVTYVQRSVALMDTGIAEAILMQGDVDGNGDLEIIDATWIQRHLAFMDTPYAIGEVVG